MKMEQKKKRIKIPRENKVRAELQKEVNSKCPFCGNDEVGHFDIHHIDENPANNDMLNFLFLWKICQSKIHSKVITMDDVIKKKKELMNKVADGKDIIIEETIEDKIAKFKNENNAIKSREDYLNSTQKNIDQRNESTYLFDRFKGIKETLHKALGFPFFEHPDHKIDDNREVSDTSRWKIARTS